MSEHSFFADTRRSLFGEAPHELENMPYEDLEMMDQLGFGPEEQPW